MERSQSCSNFERNNHFIYNNNNISNNNTNNTGIGRQQRHTKTKSSSAHNLRNLLIDGRHSSHMRQAEELQQQQQTDKFMLTHAMPHFLTSTRKKSPLQRQKSTLDPEELDYSADMEDDEDYDDYDDDDDGDDDSRHTKIPKARGIRPQMLRTTLIIDTSLKNATRHSATSLETAIQSTTTASAAPAAATTSTPTTSPSPVYMKSFRLPRNSKQLSLDLPHSPSPSLTMFMQNHHQHYRHHSLGTPDSGTASPHAMRRHNFGQLKRDNSLQSDSSHYSSVDSLLESRKPDPEAILINLGFGPAGTEDILSRIPKRFLKPSQVRGIDTEAFVKRLQMASSLADHSMLGYRGLTGNPDIPPSSIVAKIMQRFEVNERKKSMGSIETHMR